MGRRRHHQLDFLRALACVMVLAYHYLYRGHLGGWVPFEWPQVFTYGVKFGYLGVQLFFAISGFVILMSAQGATPRSFVASRAARLYPAYWAAIVLTTLVVYWGDIPSLRVPWADTLINFTMLTHWFGVEYVDSAYWTLAVELHFYVMVWALIRFQMLHQLKLFMAAWLALSLLYLVRPIYPLDFTLCVRWAPYFCLGIGAFLMQQGDRGRFVHALFAFAVLLAAAFSWKQATRGVMVQGMDGWVGAALTLVIVAVFWLISRDRFHVRGGPVLFWAATLTYPVYLLHEYIGYVSITALWQAGVPAAASVALTTVGVVLLAYVVHRWVEKPLSQRVRQWVAGAGSTRVVAGG